MNRIRFGIFDSLDFEKLWLEKKGLKIGRNLGFLMVERNSRI